MTPEEILSDLRDIHLPEQADEFAGSGFALWPIALVIVAGCIVAWLIWRRRSAWRREITLGLDRIEQIVGDGRIQEGWIELATLLRRIAMTICDKRDVAGLVDQAWLEKPDQIFKTEIFTHCPGRGITVFPYHRSIESSPGALQSTTRQLNDTIASVRKRLPLLGRAR